MRRAGHGFAGSRAAPYAGPRGGIGVERDRFRFGEFEFDAASGELRRSTAEGRVEVQRLAPQPARLLALLAAKRGELVGREEIRDRIWPGVQVEFDTSLHFCIRQIRSALGDTATEPRYVETLPRRGYRLVTAVRDFEDGSGVAQPGPPQTSRRGRDARRRPLAFVLLLLGGGAAALLLAGRTSRAPAPGPPPRVAIMPFAPPAGVTAFGDPTPIADRILEELTTRGDLAAGIVGPTTTATYTSSDDPLGRLAADYQPDYIVNGRFIEGRDGPRMLAEIIRTSDGAHVWVEAYRDLGDERRIGREIARAVESVLATTD